MYKEKQIEEMAKYCCIPCDLYDEGKDCTYYDYKTCLCAESAKALYNAGYRKASEVALEVLGEASELARRSADEAKMLADTENDALQKSELRGEQIGALLVLSALTKLKKKYTEGEG